MHPELRKHAEHGGPLQRPPKSSVGASAHPPAQLLRVNDAEDPRPRRRQLKAKGDVDNPYAVGVSAMQKAGNLKKGTLQATKQGIRARKHDA